jgi:uncharacterized protein (DUF2267 family)
MAQGYSGPVELAEQRKCISGTRGTLPALRDRLPAEEAVDLAAQLPLLVKGMYYDGWTLRISPKNSKNRSLQEECTSSLGSMTV